MDEAVFTKTAHQNNVNDIVFQKKSVDYRLELIEIFRINNVMQKRLGCSKGSNISIY